MLVHLGFMGWTIDNAAITYLSTLVPMFLTYFVFG